MARVRYVPVSRTTERLAGKRTITAILGERPAYRDDRLHTLQQAGFTKTEAREFQKLPFNDPGLRTIANTRRKLRAAVYHKARELEWSVGKRQYELNKSIRASYTRHDALVSQGPKAGEISPWELRRKAIGFVGFNPRTFTNRGSGKQGKRNKGDTHRQRVMRKALERAERRVKQSAAGRVDNETLQSWIASLTKNIKLARDRRRREELQQGRSRLRRVLRKQGG